MGLGWGSHSPNGLKAGSKTERRACMVVIACSDCQQVRKAQCSAANGAYLRVLTIYTNWELERQLENLWKVTN